MNKIELETRAQMNKDILTLIKLFKKDMYMNKKHEWGCPCCHIQRVALEKLIKKVKVLK